MAEADFQAGLERLTGITKELNRRSKEIIDARRAADVDETALLSKISNATIEIVKLKERVGEHIYCSSLRFGNATNSPCWLYGVTPVCRAPIAANREVQQAIEDRKKATIDRKVSADKYYLQLQNLLYERNHLQCVRRRTFGLVSGIGQFIGIHAARR